MLNRKYFVLLAGSPNHWDQEILQRVDSGEKLCKLQEEQFDRGRRSGELFLSTNGWAVKAGSNLQEPIIVSGSMTKNQAIEAGKQWANEDPNNREFYACKTFLT